MNQRFNQFLAAILALSLLAAPVMNARADDQAASDQNASDQNNDQIKPVVVVSLASLDQLQADVTYLTKAAGVPEFGAWFALTAPVYTDGLIKNKPAGAYVTLNDSEPKVVAFIPVDDLDKFLANLKDEIGEPKDAGAGVLEISTGQAFSLFVKQQQGWAFLSDSAENLSALPKDPQALLGGLDKKYTLAIRVFVQNLPEELRDVAATQLKAQFESKLDEELEDLDGDLRKSAETISRRLLESWVSIFGQIEQFTLGWAIDSQGKATRLDVSLTAEKESELERRLSLLGSLQQNRNGALLPDAAVSFHFSGRLIEKDAELFSLLLNTAHDARVIELEGDANIGEDQLAIRKKILNELLGVLRSTVESRKFDGSAVLVLSGDTPVFAVGGYVADGEVVERLLRNAVELGKQQPGSPKFQFNVETYQGLRIHTFSAELQEIDEQARVVFGDSLEGAVAIGKQVAYFVMGEESVGVLKKIIDNRHGEESAVSEAKKPSADVQDSSPVAQFNIAISPILKFVSGVKRDPTLAILAMAMNNAQGTDHIVVTARTDDQGLTLSLKVEEGILTLIGLAAKSLLAPGGPGF